MRTWDVPHAIIIFLCSHCFVSSRLLLMFFLLDIKESELLALLRDEEDPEDKLTQTDISDEDLLRVLDRSDMVSGTGDDPEAKPNVAVGDSLPLQGPGWEVVVPPASGGGVLSSLTG